ncbi:MarR family transcriptional regulator [Streptomyces sp. NPDC051940]|uniref:MarR family winged helix-turn-helix transcriptional regulator n=1 Tax=Streptomyces sp. NPDC051940 TaxID=3155675 RepID=UPI00342CE112
MPSPEASRPLTAPAEHPHRGAGAAAEQADSSGQLAEQLLRLTRRLHHAQKQAFRPLGLTPAQSRLLRTVGSHTQRGEAPRMADLARHLEVVPRAVTTLVDALEELGAVRRAQDPANRRVVLIELTDEGRAMLRELRRARQSAAEDILEPLTEEQRTQLGGLLSTLVDRPENHC